MIFDWTINISAVGTIVILIGGSLSIYLSWRSHALVTDVRLTTLTNSVSGLREDMKPIQGAITAIAVQNERFNAVERRVSILEDRIFSRLGVNDERGLD